MKQLARLPSALFALLVIAGCSERSSTPFVVESAHTLRDDPLKIEWPSGEFRTLQSAIDAAPNGSVLEIKQGVFEISAPLLIEAKELEIAGAGSGRDGESRVTHLVGPAASPVVDGDGNLILRAEAAEGLFHSSGSEVVIRDIKLTGFDAAIVAEDDAEGRSATTSVQDVVITDTGRGILSLGSGNLTVDDTEIQGTLWHGISFAPLPSPDQGLPNLDIADSKVLAAACAGIFLSKGTSVVANVTVLGAGCGGIVGFQANGLILDSFLLANQVAGILLQEAPSFLVADNVIADTQPRPGDGRFGDGMAFFLSSGINVESNLIQNSDRAGLSLFGSAAALADNTITCSGFELSGEPFSGVPFNFTDLGGNQCGCGSSLGPCVAVSPGLQPPASPEAP